MDHFPRQIEIKGQTWQFQAEKGDREGVRKGVYTPLGRKRPTREFTIEKAQKLTSK